MSREAGDAALRQPKRKGLSVRQTERLTGINRGEMPLFLFFLGNRYIHLSQNRFFSSDM